MLWNEDQLQRVKKETKPTLKGKWESVFSGKHMDNVPKETHVVSVMTLWASGNKGKGQRRKGRSSSPASHSKTKQTDGEEQKASQDQAMNRKTRKTRVKFHADSNSEKNRHVVSGILPCV